MITPETPLEKQIVFFESKINQYCDVIRVNPKGENVRLWIEHITGWNNEIIELQKQIMKMDEAKNFNSPAILKQALVSSNEGLQKSENKKVPEVAVCVCTMPPRTIYDIYCRDCGKKIKGK